MDLIAPERKQKKQVKPRPKQACCYNPFRLNLPLWHHSNKNNKTYFLLTKIRWYPFSNEGSESNQVFFYSKKTKTSLIHLCRCLLHILVNESDFYHAANRTTKQKNNLSPPHHQDIRSALHLEVSFATWKSESFKGSSQTTHLSGAWVDSKRCSCVSQKKQSQLLGQRIHHMYVYRSVEKIESF